MPAQKVAEFGGLGVERQCSQPRALCALGECGIVRAQYSSPLMPGEDLVCDGEGTMTTYLVP